MGLTGVPSGGEPRSVDEFILWELEQERKAEYVDGHISYFPGGTIEHGAIVRELLVALALHLDEGACRVYGSDMMVVTPRGVRFPDVVVTCDERDQAPHTVALRHPRLIVEVLSESTARTDRAAKVDEYRAMPSLEEIVLVDSRKRWSAAYHRAGAVWVASEPQTGGEVSLASVDMRLDLDGLYGRCGVPEIPREA